MPLRSLSSTQFWSPRSLDHLTFLPCFAASCFCSLSTSTSLSLSSFHKISERHNWLDSSKAAKDDGQLGQIWTEIYKSGKGHKLYKNDCLLPCRSGGTCWSISEDRQNLPKCTNYFPLRSLTDIALGAVLIQTMRCDKARRTESSLTMQHFQASPLKVRTDVQD